MGQKLCREMLELTAVRNQLDLTDTFRIFHSSTKESTFFSATHGHFSKTAHMLGYKASLKRHRKTEIALVSSLNTMDHSCTVTTKEAAGSIQTHGNWTLYYWMKTGERQKSSRKLKTFYNWMNVKTQHTQAHGSNDAGTKKNVHKTKTVLSTVSTTGRNCILITYLWHTWKF